MYDYRYEEKRVILMIDTKSFYASVEAVDHHLDPLTTPLVVVSKGANVGGGGLVLATSPMAKKLFSLKTNVSRMKDLANLKNLIQFPPRMHFYIQKNLEINNIYRNYVADEDLHPYSIDESILDITDSWHLFGKEPIDVARKIQKDVLKKTGLYVTVGLGDNITLAKIALDTIAKKTKSMFGEIHYKTVPQSLWTITDLENVWSIGRKSAKKLSEIGINSLKELAYTNPYRLQKIFGTQNGLRLYALSWGVDRATVRSSNAKTKHKSLGNSQVLPFNYSNLSEIELVVSEIADHVASRIRAKGLIAQTISIYLGLGDHSGNFHKTVRFPSSTNISKTVRGTALNIIKNIWKEGTPIRYISLYLGELSSQKFEQLDLFTQSSQFSNSEKLDKAVDKIRDKYGFTKLIYSSSLLKGATAIKRSNLIGGHNG